MLALLLVLQAALPPDPQPAYDGRARQLEVRIPRLEAEVRVDGVLDEPVWRQAARLTGFSEYRPVDGRPAVDSTEVLVWYAPDAIYFGIRAWESHGSVVRATLADRDRIDNDDNIQILLDTYHDRRRALFFAVNPLGSQEDGVRSEGIAGAAGGGNPALGRFDGVVDLNPDFVYQSRGRVTPEGYEIEVRIPFKTLRYQSTDPQTWGLQIVRKTQHTGYEDTWAPTVRASASFLGQEGDLVGLTQLKRGLVMDLTPEVTQHVDGQPGSTAYAYGHAAESVGGTVRWGMTPNLTLGGTVNPDFSQVEADVGQVTANERFALFYPEKRPFFLEGLELFDTPNRLIYTRQILNPVAGVKLTGKTGETNVGFLSAVDDRGAGSHPVLNLLRVRSDVGHGGTAGLVYTDRADGAEYNRVLGGDLRLLWKRLWFSEFQYAQSWSLDSAGVRTGTLWATTLADRTGRSYGNHFDVQGASREFEARSGFVNRTDVVNGHTANRFTWYGRPGALVEQASLFLLEFPTWRYDEFFKVRRPIENLFFPNWMMTLRGGWSAGAQISNFYVQFDSTSFAGYAVDTGGGNTAPFAPPRALYNLWGAELRAQTPTRAVQLGATIDYGATAIFVEAARGTSFRASGSLDWRPTTGLRVNTQWVHQRITRTRDGSAFSTSNIPRLKVEYQLSPAIFVRYIGQYFAQRTAALEDPRGGRPLWVDGAPAGEQVINDFRNDWLFSYRPIPGTLILFGYGASLTEPEAFRFENLSRTSDGFFLKVSYLYRM